MAGQSRQSESTPYFRQSAEEVVSALASDAVRGLTAGEAQQRLDRHGSNQLEAERGESAWRKFLAQFKDGLVILLLGAGATSALLWLFQRDSALPYEALAIIAIVLLNAVMGYVQQARAEHALAALQEMSAAQATVIRDGERQRVPASDLVPGDLILVEEGDTVPADGRLLRAATLQVAEAALTGESQPVTKDVAALDQEAALGDRHNMVFSGTSVTFGRGLAVVTATGMQTEIGQIAGMLQTAPEQTTPLQKELDRVSRMLGIGVIIIAVVMIATIIVFEHVTGFDALFDVLLLGVALAVAAVPEGLPTVVTVVLALGVQRMARRRAIVRKLATVETLGSADVIASDKTGTLTRNEMTVRRVVTANGRVDLSGTGYEPVGEVSAGGDAIEGDLRAELVRALGAADRANNAVLQEHNGRWTVQGDPTEGALIVAARKAGLEAEVLDRRFARVAEIPFSSERKRMSTVHTDSERSGRLIAFTKGAPDVLLALCSREMVGEEPRPLDEARREQILADNDALAGDALRTLAAAGHLLPEGASGEDVFDESIEQDLVFLGLIGMIDPPREEAREAVSRARAAGIRPIMITGDHPATASVIACELGIADEEAEAVTGAELEAMSEAELKKVVRRASVFARVNPEHKLKLVGALQAAGNTVAMTGDGVNDAPALKTADIGVAMGITGTDVSKQASDMVLADDNFATIVAAVEEGRAIFANIRKFLRYLLSSNLGEVLTMFFGVMLAGTLGLTAADSGSGLVLPLLATQILWINLVTDGLPALTLGLDPAHPEVMNRPPRPPGEGVLTRQMWRGIVFVGAVMAAGTLLVLDASLPGGLLEGSGDLAYAQTMAFTTLVLFQLFNVFNARSDERSAFHGLFVNGRLWGAVAASVLLQLAVVYLPFLQQAFSTVSLRLNDWLICTAVASSVLWLRELDKLAARLLSGAPRGAPERA